jgi:hypothetical protein
MKLMKVCATVLLLLPAAAFAASAFDGTWKFSADHIQLPKKPVAFVLQDGQYNCKTCRTPQTIKADGTDQKLVGDPAIDTVAITVVDANTVTTVFKLGGKTVMTRKVVVAADGKSLVDETTSLYGAAPQVYKERMTRISAGPEGSHAISGSWHESKLLSSTGPGDLVTYGMTADGFTMNSNGQSYSAKFDDKQYLTLGDPTKTMVNLKKVSDTEVIETDSQGGKPVETEDMTVSADGKTLHVVDTTLYNKSAQHYELTKQP